jgi:phospholipid/cholesterol/gamma-HCH transport system substrate-binding protein
MTTLEATERKRARLVGAFALSALVLAGLVVVLLGQRSHVFQPRVTLHASFPDVGGLREGAPVWLSGVSAGTVTRIQVGKPGERQVHVDLEVRRSLVDRIHRDSIASIGSQGLLGDKLLQVALGSPDSPPVQPGDTLPTVEPADFNKLVDQANAILIKAKQVGDNLAEITRGIADPETIASFRSAIRSIRDLLAQASHGQGLVHSLFYDKQWSERFEGLTDGLDRLVDHVDGGVRKLDQILAATDQDGRQVVNQVARAARGLGDAVDQLQQSHTIANLDRASRDLAELTNYVKSGRGTVGALVVDPTVYERLVGVLGGVERSRILRTVVRYALSRDEAKRNTEKIEVQSAEPLKPTRAKR